VPGEDGTHGFAATATLRFVETWPRVRLLGVRVVAIVSGLAGATALVAAESASRGQAPSLAAPFAIAGLGLILAAVLMLMGARSDLVEIILGGLVGGSFGVTLAEMSAQAATIEDHYKSLWVPAGIAALMVLFHAFRGSANQKGGQAGSL
jgi:hypothetical protein